MLVSQGPAPWRLTGRSTEERETLRTWKRSAASAALALVLSLAGAAGAAGQTGGTAPTPPRTVGWQDGLVIQSRDSRYQLIVGGGAQLDGRVPLDGPVVLSDAFSLRTARGSFSGRVTRRVEFRVVSGFSGASPALFGAYVDLRLSPAFRIRAGKDKTPVGYEQLMSGNYLFFPDRTLVSGLVPSRDVGLQLLGDLAGGGLSYAVGLFNGVPDGSSFKAGVHDTDGRDLAARVVVRPWRSAAAGRLRGLGGQIGMSSGHETGALPSFKTPYGAAYFAYSGTARADGRRRRAAPAVFYYHGPVGAFAEYVRSAQQVSNAGTGLAVANHAWGVSGSYVLTGEPASERGVHPKGSFDPSSRKWGALQVVARYSRLTPDPDVFAAGLAAANTARFAASFATGANWYPRDHLKYSVVFERTAFVPGAGGPRRPERIVWVRAQVAF
jgi:phosphate-selective porin OprO and OprP